MTALALFSLLNALWQGVLLVAVVALALRLLPRANAATTCAIWTATYFLVAALPAIDFALARPVTAPGIASMPSDGAANLRLSAAGHTVRGADTSSRPTTILRSVTATDIASRPTEILRSVTVPDVATSDRRAALQADDANRTGSTVLAAAHPLMSAVAALAPAVQAASALATRVAAPVLAIWIVVALGLLGRLALSYALVLRLKRAALRIELREDSVDLTRGRRAELGTSSLVRIPCAIGFLHPMIVLPSVLAETLDPDDLARVIVHEHAHLRRYDDWFNALQRVAGAIFFFQPALHYVARRIELDREVACDDEVVDTVGEPIEYAKCLTKIVDRQTRAARLAVVPGFFFGRSQVIARVDRLIAFRRGFSPRVARYGAVAAAAIVLSALALAQVQVPVIAASAHDDAPAVANTSGAPTTATKTGSNATPATTASHVRASTAPRAAHRSASSSATSPQIKVYVERGTTSEPSEHGRRTVVVKKIAPEVYVLDEDVKAYPDVTVDVDRAMRAARKAEADAEQQLHVHVRPIPPLPPMPHVRVLDADAIAMRTAGDLRDRIGDQVRASVQEGLAQVRLELADVQRRPRVDLLDALANNGYGHPSVDELVALANHGVTGDFVAGIGPLLGTRPTVQQLIALADQGIGPTYVRGIADAGYPHLQVDQLIKLRDAGVTPRFVKHLSDHGYRNLTVDQLVKLAESGV